MLLQHLSIAALGRAAQLAVPPLHVPIEHRQARAVAEVLHADAVFNFSALSPLVNVTAFHRMPRLRWMTRHIKEDVGKKMRIFAALPDSRSGRFGDSWTSLPIARVSARTSRADLSVIEALRNNCSDCPSGCTEEGSASGCTS